MQTLTCKRCGNTWVPRIDTPKKCPLCQMPIRNWREAGEPAKTTPAATSG